ncbi:MAG: phosphate ABC transporter substrate-binding protein PstS [Acidimicrobiales bacterium]
MQQSHQPSNTTKEEVPVTRKTRGKRLVPVFVLAAGLVAAACGSSTASSSTSTTGGGSTSAATPLSVEKPPAATLSETGSTLLYPLWNIWASAYQQKFPQVSINTAGTGSGTGISDAANGTVDIGSSDAYLSPSQLSSDPTLLNIPLAISVQVIAYNLPGMTAHVKLNGTILSEIYQGKITKWNNPAITAINPGVTMPSMPIVALHRSDGSGDTFIFTQYLSKQNPSGWGNSISYGTTVQWPSVPGALAENGNGGMVSGCHATPGCIAYVGISYLSQLLGDGLNYGQLQNGNGNFELPTPTAVAAEANYFTAKTPANGTISMVNGPVSGGYPIINYEYAIVNSHQQSASTATAVRSLLEWAISPTYGNSSQYLSQVAFQPLPPQVVSQSTKQIAAVK